MSKKKQKSHINTKSRKKLTSYIKYSSMKQRINEFGFSIKTKNFIFSLLIAAVTCIVMSLLFKLKPVYVALILIFFLSCTPILITLNFKCKFQEKKFAEVTLYLQQMAYSFSRKNKILNALIEVEKISGGVLNKKINQAIKYIQIGHFNEDLYKEAFGIIEDYYKCSRIKTLHTFMIEVEKYGGEYRRTLGTLIKDIEARITRVMKFQEQRKHMQRNTTISILMALGICLTVTFVLPKEITNTTNLFNSVEYQVMTTLSLMLFVIFYIVVQLKTATSWLDMEDIKKTYSFEDIKKDYDIITNYNVEKKTIIGLIASVILGAAAICTYIISGYIYIIPIMLSIVLVIMTNPQRIVKKANKRLLKDIVINFPAWIRSLSLHLQTNNLHVSLNKSLADCEGALKIEVLELIKNIEYDPVTQNPYILFMEKFNAYEIKSIVRGLYGMSKFGQAEAIEHINSIITQNNEVSALAEQLIDELKTSGLHMYSLAPMLIGSINIFVNLYIFGSSFFSYFTMSGLT